MFANGNCYYRIYFPITKESRVLFFYEQKRMLKPCSVSNRYQNLRPNSRILDESILIDTFQLDTYIQIRNKDYMCLYCNLI